MLLPRGWSMDTSTFPTSTHIHMTENKSVPIRSVTSPIFHVPPNKEYAVKQELHCAILPSNPTFGTVEEVS